MNLVRTSIAVASVFCALAWSGESFAQSSGSTDANKDTDQKTETKTTKKTTTKTTKAKKNKGSDTSHAKGSTSGSSTGSSTTGSGSSTSGSGSSDTSGSSLSGSTGSAGVTDTSGVTGSSGSTSGSTTTGSGSTGTSGSSGTMSGTGQTIGTGTDMNGTSTTGTTGTTGQSNLDQTGSVYPLGTQPNMNQGQYGTQQPIVPPTTTTSTTQTTSAVYDPSITADREGGTTTIRPNRPLLVTGSAIFLGSYAATAIQGAVSPLSADRKNLIPVAGPWINMSERPCNLNTNCSTKENVNNALLIGSGVAQGAGIAIALISLVVPEHKERSTIATAKAEPPKPSMMVVPASVGQAGAGAFAVGSF